MSFTTLYVSYREWFEIEKPDADSIPLSIADVQPIHFTDHIEACAFKLRYSDDLTFYDGDSDQVRTFHAHIRRAREMSARAMRLNSPLVRTGNAAEHLI